MSPASSQAIAAPIVAPCHVARRGGCTSRAGNVATRPGAIVSTRVPCGRCAGADSRLPSRIHRSSSPAAMTCQGLVVSRCCSSGPGSAIAALRRSEIGLTTWTPRQVTRGREKSNLRQTLEVCCAYSKSGASDSSGRRGTGGERGVVLVAASGSESAARNGVTSTTSVSTPPAGPAPSISTSPYPGSPLLWVGVGVAISVIFHRIAKEVEKRSARLQRAAMQQILKSMAGTPPGGSLSPFGMPPFPMPPTSPLGTPPQAFTPPAPPPPPPAYTTESSPTSPEVAGSSTVAELWEASPTAEQQTKSAFTDVSPDAVAWEGGAKAADEGKQPFFHDAEVMDSPASSSGRESSQTGGAAGAGKDPVFTVEALEKMMEDPLVQKMVYPYLPEEMRNPATFKWMLQNPQYRQQLQEMLGNMGGDAAWDTRMADMMKNFNLSSEDVKQQFDQIGMTPEDVISKIMANPDIAIAFQNPRVQAAIMDCSQNPLNISKYQNDKEVMDVFSRISELFPGMA